MIDHIDAVNGKCSFELDIKSLSYATLDFKVNSSGFVRTTISKDC